MSINFRNTSTLMTGFGIATFLMLFLQHEVVAEPSCGAKPELRGRVVTGYQGWFRAPGDGTGMGWVHWGRGERFAEQQSTVDLWPDMTEAGDDERYATPYRHADGSVASVFSSAHPKTVLRHYQWMRDYGIGGAFQQRFASGLRNSRGKASLNRVLNNTRVASRKTGVPWALMYDLSGLKAGEIESILYKDLHELIVGQQILNDPHYLHHNGEPVIAVWGVGFDKGRDYTVEECIKLVDKLRNDREIGGNAVMVGVPYWWRDNRRDAEGHPRFHELLRRVQIISPWSAGRVRSPEEAGQRVNDVLRPDLEWTQQNKKAYLPVIFPGFSWVNLKRANGEAELPKYDAIPRLNGRFLWSQAVAAKQAGAAMVYVAMFDEVDEGTAIFKVTNDPPVNGSDGERFISYGKDVPPDHYLWLTREIGSLLAGELPVSQQMPERGN